MLENRIDVGIKVGHSSMAEIIPEHF
jgi:hypothetical protein